MMLRQLVPGPLQSRERLDARAVLLVVGVCGLWGLQQVAIKVAVTHGLPPVIQAAGRSAIAGVLVVAWNTWRADPSMAVAGLRPRELMLPGLLLGASFTAEFAVRFTGIALTSVGRGTLFFYTAPFITAVGAHCLLRNDKLTALRVAGLLIAFAGVALAFADGLRRGHDSLMGDVLCLIAAVFWATSTLLIKGNRDLRESRPETLLIWRLAISAPALLILSYVVGEWRDLAWPLPLAWLCLAYEAVVVTFVSYLAWGWLVLTYPASRLAPFTFMAPMFAVMLSGLLLDEAIGPGLWVGIAAIGVGLRLLNSR